MSAFDPCCVTIFGFSPAMRLKVMAKFQECGKIVVVKTSTSANWVFLHYEQAGAARQALEHDGRFFDTNTIIGVRPSRDVDNMPTGRGQSVPSVSGDREFSLGPVAHVVEIKEEESDEETGVPHASANVPSEVGQETERKGDNRAPWDDNCLDIASGQSGQPFFQTSSNSPSNEFNVPSCASDDMDTQLQNDGHWVTVFGFPKGLARKASKQMRQFGNITDLKMPANNCNWFYMRYSRTRDARKAAKNQNAKLLNVTVMIGVKLHGMQGAGYLSEDETDCKPTTRHLLPTTQQLSNVMENVRNADDAIDQIKVDDERKSDHSYSCYYTVRQPVNTCDGNTESETSDIARGNMEENEEKCEELLEMTVEFEKEGICQKRANSRCEVDKKGDDDFLDHESWNGDFINQANTSLANVQGLQELCEEHSSLGGVNEDKDGGILERKTHKFSRKDKEAGKQPSKLCADSSVGRGERTSADSSHRQRKNKQARHQCDVCGYITNHSQRLVRHMRTHSQEKPFVCEVCNKGFAEQGNLRRHETGHSDDKKFLCDNCGRRFSRKENLQIHRRMHSDVKAFECKICHKVFTYERSLRGHQMSQHQKNAPVFQCRFCDYENKCKQYTMSHEIRCHTKEYPHYCNICHSGFIHQSTLHKHISSNHRNYDHDLVL